MVPTGHALADKDAVAVFYAAPAPNGSLAVKDKDLGEASSWCGRARQGWRISYVSRGLGRWMDDGSFWRGEQYKAEVAFESLSVPVLDLYRVPIERVHGQPSAAAIEGHRSYYSNMKHDLSRVMLVGPGARPLGITGETGYVWF